MSEQKMTSAEEYLVFSQKEALRAVDHIMKAFDFEKAARALKACGYKYSGATKSLTASQLRIIGRGLLQSAIQSGSGCTSSQGWLEARTFNYDTPAVVTVTLSLVPVIKSSVYVDARVLYAKQQRKLASAKKVPK